MLVPSFNFIVGHCEMVLFACPQCDVKGFRYPFTFLLILKAVGMASQMPQPQVLEPDLPSARISQIPKISLLAVDQEVR